MYKVKRFSQVDMSSINVRYFSCDEQREFNALSDIYHSGIKRTFQKYAGRARRNVAGKIQNSIQKDIEGTQNAVNTFMNSQAATIPNVEKGLIKDARNLNARTMNIPLGFTNKENFVVHTKEMRNNPQFSDGIKSMKGERVGRKVMNAANKNDSIIFHPSGSGTSSLAHEVGHVENSKTRNPIRRVIEKVANSKGTRVDLQMGGGMNESGIKPALKRYITGKAVLAEERNASKAGLRMMKKHGATKEQLDEAKKLLDTAADTYKGSVNVNYKSPIYNWVQIPSRKNK